MKELITAQQANQLMAAIVIIAPIIGLIWGAVVKRVAHGLAGGVAIGVLNFAMWRVYNAITDQLGLDTVKSLLVNLGLFLVVGIIGGLIWGRLVKVKPSDDTV